MIALKSYDGDPSEHIAIVGMTGRFPGAKNITEFWQNLHDGVESISFFTPEELAAANIEKSLLNNPRYVGADGVIEDMDMFDAEFFNVTPREAELMDPQHRLFLECAWEVMEQAGYDSESYDGRVAVYGSANLSTYLIRNIMSKPDLRETATSFQTMITNDKDFVATRVSYKLNLTGPSMSVATLCSSSFVAIHLACQALLNYQCDLALAGAISLQASRNETFFYQEGGIGDPDGHCRAFDAKASGTVSGNGIGIVALRRLEDALADGDTIHAVIRGTALNNDGAIKYSYTAPSMEGQAEVIADAISLAEVDPETITYVETHGTGTRLGDPIEVTALTKSFRVCGARRNQYCAIGSVKTNIGHLVNAGGVASLIKTVLAMQHKQIPASLHFDVPNPEIDFENSPFFVNTRLREWETNGFPRRAGVSSFGIGGTNVHIIVEETPETDPSGESRPWQLLVFSAKTAAALEGQTANLLDYLEQHPDANLADVAFTLQIGRRAFDYRRMLLCCDREDAISALSTMDPQRVLTQFQESHGRPVAFMFPDVEGHHVDTSLDLYRGEPTFREQVERCAEILNPVLRVDLRHILYPGNSRTAEAQRMLEQTAVGRAATFTLEYALAILWMKWEIRPQTMLGDGVGECVAACLAGVLTLEDALVLATGGQVEQTHLNPPQIPFLSSVTGVTITDADATDPDYWTARLGQAARFDEGMRVLLKESEQVLLEIGPGNSLSVRAAGHPAKIEQQVVLSSLPPYQDGQANLAFLLTTVGKLWLAGVRVDWKGFHTHERRCRIPLPTYPFERKRYWIEPVKSAKQEPLASHASPEKLLTAKKPDIADWFYVPCWRRAPLPVGMQDTPEQSCWLLFVDACGVGIHLAECLKQQNQRVAIVRAGPQFTKLGGDMFALNPGQRVEYVALLNELSTAGMRPQKIVHMWNVTRDDLVAPADYAQDLGFYGPLLLAQALGIRNFTDELRLTVVSNQAHEAVPGDNLRPEKATLLGALKVIPQEYPNIVCRSVDLALPEPGGWQERKLVSQLLAELSQNSEDRVIAYRGRQRLVQAFEPIRLEKATQASSLLRAGGVYLIFDGLQGIGLTLAEHLARTIQARLALTKSPETTVAKPTRLADMADVLVIDVDVTDRAQVSSAVAQAEERFGRLNGVIYTGNFGQAPLRSIREIDKAECEQQLQAAVHGLPMLAQVLAEKELDFCLLTSSLSSILGGPGLAAYAATNSFIDAFAHQSNRASATPWISVNWDGWRFEQDHTDNTPFIAHTDELAITPPEGMEAFERILSVGDVGQVAVSTVDLQARIDRWVRLESVQTTSKSPGKTTALHARPNLLVPYVAPRDKTEQVLANVWQELIGIEKVGIYDNFVELGGDSLIGVQIIARANEAGLRLTPQQLFQHQTIAELAAVEGDIVVQAEQGIVTGPAPLTVSQHWFFSHEFVDLHRWNATTLFEVPPDMNPALTERVVKYMLDHHDALRARFTYEGTKWQQTIVAPDQIGSAPFMCIDLSGLPVAEHATALERAADKLQGSLNLSEGPLFRVALFNLGADRRGRLLIVAHHLVLDGPSRSILMEDFQTAYRQLSHGEPVRLPPKTTSLKQWSEQVSAYAQSEDLRQEMGYWLNLPWEQVLLLPTDFPEGRNHNTWASLSSVLLRLSVDETDVLLREVPKIYNAQVLDALLMALAQAVTQWTGGRCMAVRAVDTGRQLIPTADNVDLSRTVGWLSLTRGIVLERAEMDDPGEALKSIRDQLRHAPNRGLGYEVLLFCSNDTEIAERLKNLPIFDLDFNYVSQQEGELVGTDLLAPSLEFVGDWQNPRNKSAYLLTCQVFIAGGRLVARWMYSENAHKRATINKVARDFIEVLRALVVHCQSGSTDGGQSRLITEKP